MINAGDTHISIHRAKTHCIWLVIDHFASTFVLNKLSFVWFMSAIQFLILKKKQKLCRLNSGYTDIVSIFCYVWLIKQNMTRKIYTIWLTGLASLPTATIPSTRFYELCSAYSCVVFCFLFIFFIIDVHCSMRTSRIDQLKPPGVYKNHVHWWIRQQQKMLRYFYGFQYDDWFIVCSMSHFSRRHSGWYRHFIYFQLNSYKMPT